MHEYAASDHSVMLDSRAGMLKKHIDLGGIPMSKKQPFILPTASVIVIDENGRILLQHRRDNGYWGLPGGAMEVGESFEETARREVLEETGLSVGKLELYYLHSGKHTFWKYPDGNQVYTAGVIFKTNDFTGELLADKAESLAVGWFTTDALPSISPHQKPVFQFYLENR